MTAGLSFDRVELATDVGRRRDDNQDAVADAPGFVVVCDGMGGHEDGGLAACIARDVLLSHRDRITACGTDGEAVTRAFEVAFTEATRAVEARLGGRGGTTAICAAVCPSGRGAFVAHVGDSRAYLVAGHQVSRLTEDHNYLQVLMERGMEEGRAQAHPAAMKLTQALGLGPVTPDVARVDMGPEDRLLLCSDGLYDMVAEHALGLVLDGRDAKTGVAMLVEAANHAGGHDNISVALIRVHGERHADVMLGHLRAQALFAGLSESELRTVATLLTVRDFDVGDVLVQEGNVGAAVLLLVRGHAVVSRGAVHLTDVRPGDQVGELSLVRPWRRSATVTAREGGRVYVLSRHHFEQLCATRPRLGVRLFRALCGRVAERLDDLTERVGHAATTR